jgi:hypothetical protein
MGRSTPSPAMLSVVTSSTLAVLGTTGPHGPHLAPVWFLYRDGDFLLTTGVTRQKAKNIQHDYRVGLSVLAEGGSPAVMVDGTARLDHVEVVPLVSALAQRNLGAEAGAQYVEGLMKNFTPETLWRIVLTPAWWKSWALDEKGDSSKLSTTAEGRGHQMSGDIRL